MAKPPFTKEHPCPGCASTDVSLDDVAEWAKHSIIAIDNASDKYRRGKITLEELQAVIKKSMTGQHD